MRVTLCYMSEPSVVKSVRMPRPLADHLDEQARIEHRTVNNLITTILTEGLEQRRQSGGRPPPDGFLARKTVPGNSKDLHA